MASGSLHSAYGSLNVVSQLANQGCSKHADSCDRAASLRLSNQPAVQAVPVADCIISCCHSKSDANYMQAEGKLNKKEHRFLLPKFRRCVWSWTHAKSGTGAQRHGNVRASGNWTIFNVQHVEWTQRWPTQWYFITPDQIKKKRKQNSLCEL